MKNLLNQKKFKYAAFSATMTALVIGIILIVNIIIGQFDFTLDMTSEKSNSLSNDTIEYLNELDQDVTIYALYKNGEIYKPFEQLLNEYENHSEHVTVEYVDPYQNPQFVDQYKTENEDIPVGSFVVQGENKFKVVDSSGLIQVGQQVTVNNLEPKLTNAIIYVNDLETPTIYKVTGHSEIELGANIESSLKDSNFDVKSLELMTESIPEDCSVLMLTSPQNDYTTDEVEKVISYLDNGGKAFITTDALLTTDKPNYNSILTHYGVKSGNYITVEGDKSKFVQNIPINIMPTIENTDLTSSLFESKRNLLLPTATGIDTLDTKNQSVTVTPLLTSSEKSYGKSASTSTSFSYENGDKTGPIPLSVLISDSHTLSDEIVTEIVVTGTSAIIDDGINSTIGGGNAEFVVSANKYLVGEKEDLYLSSKVIQNNNLTMSFSSAIIILLYSVVVLPLAILIIGGIIFFRRKNR